MPQPIKRQGKSRDGKAWSFVTFGNETSANMLEEIFSESDRTAVIVGFANLEKLVRLLLETFLISEIDNENNELSHVKNIKVRVLNPANNGPLATFSGMADIAYLLGLLTKDMHDLLKNMAKIRNNFAHNPRYRTFEDLIQGATQEKSLKKNLDSFKNSAEKCLKSRSNFSEFTLDLLTNLRACYISVLTIVEFELKFAIQIARKARRRELKDLHL